MKNLPTRLGRLLPLLPTTLLLLATSPLACTPIHGEDPAAVPSQIDAPPDPAYIDTVESARPIVRAMVVEENLPGLSLAVGVAGEVIWAEGFGWADIDERVPVTPQTRFRIGNVAMPMTATAVGLLHERGLLDLDAPVQKYVPSFPEKEWPVTTRQLMAHVAGVRRYSDDEELLYMRRHCDTALDGLELFAGDPLLFEPGTRYRYSPYGWALVGAIVEAAAGEPFLDFLQREVLDPLEMRDTVLDDPAGPAGNRTSCYWPRAARKPNFLGVEGAIREDAENTCIQGAGSLLSTPTDVVRFGLAMLEGRLLRPETLEMLQKPLQLGSGESTGYGLGWFVREVSIGPASEPTTVFGHEGSSVGGTTSFVVLPEHGIVIAATTNVSFAKSLATEPELGTGLRPFFRDSALPRVLANTFVQANAADPR
jgi:CubicO group peptidase (beta-lactamase class C family)